MSNKNRDLATRREGADNCTGSGVMFSLYCACSQNETAELYAMNRLNPDAWEAFEEHLLLCPACAKVVEFADEFVPLFRAASNHFELDPLEVELLAQAG